MRTIALKQRFLVIFILLFVFYPLLTEPTLALANFQGCEVHQVEKSCCQPQPVQDSLCGKEMVGHHNDTSPQAGCRGDCCLNSATEKGTVELRHSSPPTFFLEPEEALIFDNVVAYSTSIDQFHQIFPKSPPLLFIHNCSFLI